MCHYKKHNTTENVKRKTKFRKTTAKHRYLLIVISFYLISFSIAIKIYTFFKAQDMFPGSQAFL